VGAISFYPYIPNEVTSLSSLPPTIVEKVTDHLKNRLGESFYSKLRFSSCIIVDFDDLYRVKAEAKDFHWKVFTYKLEYAFSMEKVGIKRYEAEIWLDKYGEVIQEIDLPDIRNQPEKATIISVDEAIRISKENGLKPTRVELAYRREDDSIVWRTVRFKDGITRQLDISAHTGKILNKVGMKGIE